MITYPEQEQQGYNPNMIIRACNQFNPFSCFQSYSYGSNTGEEFVFNKKNNYIQIQTLQILQRKDLDILLALLQQVKMEYGGGYVKQINEPNIEKNLVLNVNMTKLASLLKRKDGGSFRESVIESLHKLSQIFMSWKKLIKVDGVIEEGGSNFLNYVITYTIKKQRKKYKKVQVLFNALTLKILFTGSYNYALINMDDYLKLPPKFRIFYFKLYRKLIPGYKHAITIKLKDIIPNWENRTFIWAFSA